MHGMRNYSNIISVAVCLIILTAPWIYGSALGQSFGKVNYESIFAFSEPEPQQLQTFEEDVALDNILDPGEYIIGPGDEFSVFINTIDSRVFPVKVTPAGNLILPRVGTIPVHGLTLSAVIEKIENTCRSVYLDAKIDVDLVNIRNFMVLVSGAVKDPGFVKTTPMSRVTDAIARAGMVKQLAKEHEILLISAEKDTVVLNLNRFVSGGELSQNPYLDVGMHIHVEFGDLEKEGIVVRGAVTGKGYDIIEPDETLDRFMKRRLAFQEQADLDNVMVERLEAGTAKHHIIPPEEFDSFILQPKDKVEILSERPVIVQGRVGNPGSYQFVPGFRVGQYLDLAGGVLDTGSEQNVEIIHMDGSTVIGLNHDVQRGDVIVVPRSPRDILIGEITILSFITAISSLLLTFLAATSK